MRGRPSVIPEQVILDAARDVFLEHGLGATTAEIAGRAKVSESIIFYRYKTKAALFAAVLEHQAKAPPIFDDLPARVGKGEIADHLFSVGEGLLGAARSMLPFFMMMRSAPAEFSRVLHDQKHPHPSFLHAVRRLSGYFEAEVERGRLRAVDTEILARAFLGGVFQHVAQQALFEAADALPLAFPMFLRGFIDILLEGARKRRAGSRRC
jgi:AcrR family transcriptional regulator